MQLLSIILIGIAANLDNLGISLSYGLRYHRIPLVYNLVISFISMLFAYFSILAGSLISGYIPMTIANMIGGLVLIGLGSWFIWRPANHSNGTSQRITTIHWKESIMLGFLLAINCLSIGFGAGFTGVPPFLASLSIGIFSFISIVIGVKLGHRIGYTWFGQQSDRIAGALLVLIGLYEIFI
ncbi:putative Mn2+ efflux pump MntP [Sporosarcina luteola]|nr:putative Mn2+ efflux pump MntP [Sporosarcina luteola]